MEKHLLDQIYYTFKKEGIPLLEQIRIGARIIFKVAPENMLKAIMIMRYVIGVHSFSPGFSCSRDYEVIKKNLVEFALWYLQPGESFCVRARHSKPYPMNTMELERHLGGAIYDTFAAANTPLKVDLKNPDKTIHVEIREKGAYILPTIIATKWGGNPFEPDKAMLTLWTEKKEDLVGSLLMMRRGSIIVPVQFNDSTLPVAEMNNEGPASIKSLSRFFPDPLPSYTLYWKSLHHAIKAHFIDDLYTAAVFFGQYLLLSKFMALVNEDKTHGVHFMNCHLQFRGIVTSISSEDELGWKIIQSFPFLHLSPAISLYQNTIDLIDSELLAQAELNSWQEILTDKQLQEEFSLAQLIIDDIEQKKSQNRHSTIENPENNRKLIDQFDKIKRYFEQPEILALVDEIILNYRKCIVDQKISF
jgi:hypothetical protein